jgi:adenylate cyclase
MVRCRKAIVLGLVIGALGVGVRPTGVGLRLEEDVGLRWLFAVRGPIAPPPHVVVVTIDKASAQQLGLDTREWPPERRVHASVIRALASHHVSAIIMDIRFEKHRSVADDDDLADAIAESGNVVLAQHIERLTVPGVDGQIEQIHSPIEELQRGAISLGPFPLPESPLTHFFWPFFGTTAGTIPTLPVIALQIHALPTLGYMMQLLDQGAANDRGDLPSRVTSAADSKRLMQVLRRKFESDQQAARRILAALDGASGGLTAAERRVLAALVKLYAGPDMYYLNFYGPAGSIETIPFHELLQDELHEQFALAGKVVFVGEGASELVTSAEQPDTYRTIYSTSEGVDLSGAEIGATAFANLLTERTLRPVGLLSYYGVLLAFGGLVAFVARLLPGVHATATAMALAVVYWGLTQFLFTAHSLLVPLAIPLLVQLPLALFVGLLARYRDIRRQVPIEVDPYLGQQVFQGVCLTTDVKGYTSLAERMKPGELALLLDEYYDMLRGLVAARGGLVWGRAGDSALCVWKGSKVDSRFAKVAPGWLPGWLGRQAKADTDIRLNACLAAIELRDAIERFNERHPPARQLPTRIGLDAGEVGLGPVSGELQAVGIPATTASRIEGLNKELSTRLLASGRVVHDLDALVCRRLGSFLLLGKSEEVLIFEILGRRGATSDTDEELCERFAVGLELYDSGNWSDAARFFQQLALDYPSDGPARYYRDLCQRQVAVAPPTGGRPVIRIDTK